VQRLHQLVAVATYLFASATVMDSSSGPLEIEFISCALTSRLAEPHPPPPNTPVVQGGPSRAARMLKRALVADVGDSNPLEYDNARVDRAASRSGASLGMRTPVARGLWV
jgi:hypothetical protein